MNQYTFKEGSMRSLIDQMVDQVGGKYNRQIYTINNDSLKVKIKYFQLLKGLEFSINNYQFSNDSNVIFEGDKEDQRYICFRFSYSGDIIRSTISNMPEVSPSGGMIVYDTTVSTEIHLHKNQNYQWIGVRVSKSIMENDEHLFNEIFGNIFAMEEGKEWLLYDNVPLEIHILLKDVFSMDESKAPIIQNTFLIARACEMISIFFDRILNRKHKTSNKGLHSEDFEKLMQVKNYILKSLDHVPSLNELSDVYGFSVSKLRRDFQQVFGTTIVKFHLNYRLEKAKILLATSNSNIQHISRTCGFKSSSKFSFYFKKKYEITPKEVAKKYHRI